MNVLMCVTLLFSQGQDYYFPKSCIVYLVFPARQEIRVQSSSRTELSSFFLCLQDSQESMILTKHFSAWELYILSATYPFCYDLCHGRFYGISIWYSWDTTRTLPCSGLQIHLTNRVATPAPCKVLSDTVLHPERSCAGGGDRQRHKYISHQAGGDD